MVRRGALPRLLSRLEGPSDLGVTRGDDPGPLVARIFRPRRFWPTTCLYRALGGFALLRSAGRPARFVIGVRGGDQGVLAHAWVERDGQPIGGPPASGEPFAVAYTWPPDPPATAPAQTVDEAGVERNEEAVLTELRDGTGVLLHLQTRFYFTLNPTGVRVWKMLHDGPVPPVALGRRLAAAFPGVDPARVQADVDALLHDLRHERLIIDRTGLATCRPTPSTA